MSGRRERRTPLWAWWIGVGLLHALLFGPIAYRALYRGDDFVGPNLFPHHTWFSTFAFEDVWRPATPGYLFLFAARSVNEVLRSSDPRLGAVIATSFFYALFGVAIFEALRRTTSGEELMPRAGAAVGSVLIALLESPAALLGWTRYVAGDLFLPLYLPFAPTTIGSLGLNVLLMLEVGRLVDGTLPARSRWRVPVLVVLATIAKPTLSPLLMLVVVIVVVAERWTGASTVPFDRGRWMTKVRSVGLLVLLPGLAVLIPQYLATAYLVQYPRPGFDDRGSWTFAPLAELRDLNALTVTFWLALVFPLVAVVLLRSRLWSDAPVRLALIAAAIGIGLALALERTGSSDWKGDMLQLPAAAVAVLMVFIPRRVYELFQRQQIARVPLIVLSLVLLPYLLAGMTSWSCHVGLGCPAL